MLVKSILGQTEGFYDGHATEEASTVDRRHLKLPERQPIIAQYS